MSTVTHTAATGLAYLWPLSELEFAQIAGDLDDSVCLVIHLGSGGRWAPDSGRAVGGRRRLVGTPQCLRRCRSPAVIYGTAAAGACRWRARALASPAHLSRRQTERLARQVPCERSRRRHRIYTTYRRRILYTFPFGLSRWLYIATGEPLAMVWTFDFPIQCWVQTPVHFFRQEQTAFAWSLNPWSLSWYWITGIIIKGNSQQVILSEIAVL